MSTPPPHELVQRAIAVIAAACTDDEQRVNLARFVSRGPALLSVGKLGKRRTPSEVVADLWGVDAALDLTCYFEPHERKDPA